MDTGYHIEESSVEAFIALLEGDYELLEDIEDLDKIENLYGLMDLVFEDYKESGEYDPEFAFIVGKHLKELGKHFQGLAEDDAKVMMRMADETSRSVYGNNLSLGCRKNWDYGDDPRLNKIEKDYKAIKKTRNARKKKLRNEGKATKNPSYYISISKN